MKNKYHIENDINTNTDFCEEVTIIREIDDYILCINKSNQHKLIRKERLCDEYINLSCDVDVTEYEDEIEVYNQLNKSHIEDIEHLKWKIDKNSNLCDKIKNELNDKFGLFELEIDTLKVKVYDKYEKIVTYENTPDENVHYTYIENDIEHLLHQPYYQCHFETKEDLFVRIDTIINRLLLSFKQEIKQHEKSIKNNKTEILKIEKFIKELKK